MHCHSLSSFPRSSGAATPRHATPLARARQWVAGALFAFLSALAMQAAAQDLRNTQDPPQLKRFAGASIVAQDHQRFATYALPTGAFVRYDFETRRREFKSEQTVEGAVTRTWYEIPGAATSTEVLRNYRNDLLASGFQVLHDSSSAPRGSWTNFLAPFGNEAMTTSRSNYVFFAAPVESIRFATFKRSGPDGDVFVSVTTVEWPRPDATYRAARGVYAAVDVIESAAMRQSMVKLSADEMSKAITTTGRVALYGLYFDSGSHVLRSESLPALGEIARLLQIHPKLRLRVVGHTDADGDFRANQTLSRLRAEEIVGALSARHGIAATRLSSFGLGDLAPVATNETADGRAKNRRVELVPG